MQNLEDNEEEFGEELFMYVFFIYSAFVVIPWLCRRQTPESKLLKSKRDRNRAEYLKRNTLERDN